ncbi:MAG TPA: LLM class flavin-dependent oxidoreductase, partial [Chloroflexota bacterium]|nr:LLM class flavin-dependent oxidoreductase [Chloroflexota bacterium]
MIKFGLNLPNGGACADPRTLAEFAAVAEAAGWDGVFLEDYLVYQNQAGTPTYDPWVCLAAMAMRTSRIKLGTTVTPLPRRRAQKLAAETVALDHLSSGRVILGVGLGDGGDASLDAFGDALPVAERARVLDEQLEAIVGLWSGEPFSYHGSHVQIENVTLMPKPVQRPRIPIWVGGRFPNPRAVARAARWDGSCLFKSVSADDLTPVDWTPEDLSALRSVVAQWRALDGYDIAIGGRQRAADWEADRALISQLAD